MESVVTKRRSLTPIAGMPHVGPGAHAMRRGTARKEMTERVTIRAFGGAIYEGWALNGSTGGLRAILDTEPKEDAAKANAGKRIALGAEVQVIVGEGASAIARRARIVWMQEEPDGVVVGLEFMSVSGLHRGLAPSAPPGAEIVPVKAQEPLQTQTEPPPPVHPATALPAVTPKKRDAD